MEPWHQGLGKQNVVFILGKSETSTLQDSIELNEFVSATSLHYFVFVSSSVYECMACKFLIKSSEFRFRFERLEFLPPWELREDEI